MTFNINFPLPGGIPATDVGTFQANWAKLNSDFQIDHIAFTAATDNGFHTKVTFNDVALDPAIGVLLYPRSELYTKHTPVGSTNLFFAANDSTDAVQTIRQLTNLPAVIVANAGTAGGNFWYVDTPWGVRLITLLTNAFAGNRTVICPAGSGTVISYVATPNTVTASTFGGVTSGGPPPETLTFGNTNNQSLRILIITLI